MPKYPSLVTITIINVSLCLVAFMGFPGPSSADTPPANVPTHEPTMLETALRDARSTDSLRRLTAVRVLGALADPSAKATLESLLDDEDRAVATAAAHALSRITHDPSPLLAIINGGLDEAGAVSALNDCTGPAVDDALKMLAMPRDPFVRGAALRAYVRRSPREAVSMVRDALESPERTLRIQALESALRAPHHSFEKALRQCVVSDDALEHRLALGALAHAGDSAAAAELVSGVDHSDPWDAIFVSETCAWAEIPGAAAAWQKATLALSSGDRVAALSRFRVEMPAALREPMRPFLNDRDPAARLAAGITLGSAGEVAARAVLRQAVDAASSDPLLAADAAVVLASLNRR